MKKTIFLIMLCLGFTTTAYSDSSPKYGAEVVSLVKSLYKQDTKTFLRIEIKEPISATVNYYQRFFTLETSKILTKNLTEPGVLGPFGNSEDPRYGDPISVIPESDWSKSIDRKVAKTSFHNPLFINNQATLTVDTLIKDSNEECRSVYNLIRTESGWKIDDITWGPKGTFEEGFNMGLQSIRWKYR